MTIQVPLAAFSLVSSSLANPPRAESYTLTLRLTPLLASPSDERMSGKVKADEIPAAESVLRAAIVPADGPGLIITF